MQSSSSSSHPPTDCTTKPTRKSPPPPTINLDDCRPLPLVSSSPRNSDSTRSGSAFVFTSSRTARLQGLQECSEPDVPVSPPATPASSVSSAASISTVTHKSRPTLSQLQLAKHSEGAVDTRCILGANMRAAGFVHLSQAVSPLMHPSHYGASHALSSSPPSSPGSTAMGIHTPIDPPPFPPIVFVNPSVATPMWEYQKGLDWTLGRKDYSTVIKSAAGDSLPNIGADTRPAEFNPSSTLLSAAVIHPPVRSPSPSVTGSSKTGSSLGSISSGTLVSSSSSSSFLSRSKAKEKARAVDPDVGLDGYPFPPTPERSRLSTLVSSPATQSIDSSSCFSVASSSSAASSSPHTSQSQPSHLQQQQRKAKVKETAKEKHRSKTSTAIRSRAHTDPAELSLTELCSVSSQTWTMSPDFLITSGASKARSGISPSACSASSGSEDALDTSPTSRTAKLLNDVLLPTPTQPPKEKEKQRIRHAKNKDLYIATTTPSFTSPSILKAKSRTRAPTFPLVETHTLTRTRDTKGKMLEEATDSEEADQSEKEHLTAMLYAHRERDREYARHTEQEREREKQQKRARAKRRSIMLEGISGDTEPRIDLVAPVPS